MAAARGLPRGPEWARDREWIGPAGFPSPALDSAEDNRVLRGTYSAKGRVAMSTYSASMGLYDVGSDLTSKYQ